MKAHPILFKFMLATLVLLLAGFLPSSTAGAQSTPVVQAVLFYRSTCSHCIQLVSQVLPPIVEKYGDRLQIFYCDVSFPAGDALFTSAIDSFSIKTIGVPTIIVGEQVLIGSRNIEEQFPAIIDAGLAGSGLGWPAIPGLENAFSSAGSMEMPPLGNVPGPSDLLPLPGLTPAPAATKISPQAPAPTPAIQPDPTNLFIRNFQQDRRGNSLAVIVLIGMIASVIYGIIAFFKRPSPAVGARYIVPLLCLVGAGISIYLAYVEITLAEAICGPVGNCNAVQSSSYARLFGILPIGVLGLLGYIAILIAWMVARFGRDSRAEAARFALVGLTLLGILFSIYLTFLEPFVIGATCLWCLASAILMTALFLLNIAPAGRSGLLHPNT